MCSRSFLSIALLSVAVAASAEDTPERLGYQTFVDDVQAGRVKSVEMSSGIGASNDITVTVTKDGQESTYSVQRPYRPSEDPVLLEFLKKNQVSCKLVEKKDIEGHFDGFFGLETVVMMFGIPVAMLVLLIIAVVRMGRVREDIKSLESFIRIQSAIAEGQRLPPIPQGGVPQRPAP